MSTSRSRTLRRQGWVWIPPAALSAILGAPRNCSVTWKGTHIFWKESQIQRPAKCLILLLIQPHTEKNPVLKYLSPAFSSLSSLFFFLFFKNYSYSIFSILFYYFLKRQTSPKGCREAAAAALQTCLQPESRTGEMEKEPTSGMLNGILPRETSRNHTLLWTHIHSLPLLSLHFPWVLWQRRISRFLERGLCMLATFPAALAGKKCLKF